MARPFSLLVAVGNVIDFEPVAASAVGEEEHRVVHRGGIDLLDEVVVARRACFDADAAAALCLELGQRNTLDVTHVRHSDDHFVVGIEVFGVELFCAGQDFGSAHIAVLSLYLEQIVLHHLAAELVVREDLVVVFDFLHQVVELSVEFLLIEACELTESHLHDGLALNLVQSEAGLQSALCVLRSLALLDDIHHLVDVVAGDDESLQDVSPLLSLAEVVLGAADGDIVAVFHEVADEVLECEQLRTALHAPTW